MSLSPREIEQVSRIGVFRLAAKALVQHHIDGGLYLPAGSYVYVMQTAAPDVEDQYNCLELLVECPGLHDVEAKLPPGVRYLRWKKPQRLLVFPDNEERKYIDALLRRPARV